MYSFGSNRRFMLVVGIFGVAMLVAVIVVFIIPLFSPSAPSSSASHTKSTAPAAYQGIAYPKYSFAPYVDVTATKNLFTLINAAQQQDNGGTRFFTLAFVTATTNCQATWEGAQAITAKSAPYQNEIKTLQASGGDAIVSFGGPVAGAGVEQQDLALSCHDVASLRQQYQMVIDQYRLTHIDFDIEAASLQDDLSIDMRNQALALLHSGVKGKPLSISYTLPATPAVGLSPAGYNLLANAMKNHVTISTVNLLTMNLYNNDISAHKMGANIIKAVARVFSQLEKLQQDTNVMLPAGIGITPMLGQNTDPTERFTLDDAQQLLIFSELHKQEITRLSLWSLQRDQPCTTDGPSDVHDTCSGLTQPSYAFNRLLNTFTSDSTVAPAVTPTPTPSPTPKPKPKPTPRPTPTASAPLPPPVVPTLPVPTPTTPPRRGNFVANPTFNGLTGWACDSHDVAQNNTLRIIPSSSTNGSCSQVITGLQTNHTYTLQAYVKGSYAYLQANGQVNSAFSTDYTLLRVQFSTHASTSVTISIMAGYAQPEVDVQNVSLQ
ncbi:hypothetical protein [Dictyobacter arantiisoli]|uniref:GH18 domain-containing protein n=1 Tax=Dictyobacter arantiisoli TaxID=2014874 RepID=A0A5A5T5X5_9CHLR|nr:hypothetical protein [Dictyobacter arantiisoli]GCF06782.1 hypothetical protein KDI_03460 [Dictyobacter arantiisoli]